MTPEEVATMANEICEAADAVDPPQEWAGLEAEAWIEKRAEQIVEQMKIRAKGLRS